MSAHEQAGMLEIGAAAPDFRLSDLEQRTWTLEDLTAQAPIVLAFYKISCPVCQFTFPFLERIHQGRSPGAPPIFGVSQDRPEATRQFNTKFGVTFPVLLDRAEDRYPAGNAFRITTVPSIFLVEKGRHITQSFAGFDRAEMEKLGVKFGARPFRPDEQVPEFRPG